MPGNSCHSQPPPARRYADGHRDLRLQAALGYVENLEQSAALADSIGGRRARLGGVRDRHGRRLATACRDVADTQPVAAPARSPPEKRPSFLGRLFGRKEESDIERRARSARERRRRECTRDEAFCVDLRLARRVRQAQIARRAERAARHDRDSAPARAAALPAPRRRVIDAPSSVRPSCARTSKKRVESALRDAARDARDARSARASTSVAPRARTPGASARPARACPRAPPARRAARPPPDWWWSGPGCTSQALGHGLGREHPADAKPGHREALADAVDDDDALAQVGRHLEQRALLESAVHQRRVDLVDHDPDRMPRSTSASAASSLRA